MDSVSLCRKPGVRPLASLVLGAMLFSGCQTTHEAQRPSETKPSRQLRVALFPYVPDANQDHFRSLRKYLETAFEARQHGEVDLVLMPFEPETDAFYAPDKVKAWLSPGTGSPQPRWDVVEVDTLLLDEVKAAAQPWTGAIPQDNWHPAASKAVSASAESALAYPHLLCSHFLFSRDENVSKATNADALVAALQAVKPERKLVGDFQGSWNLPALFLDAYADSVSPNDLAAAIPARGAALDATALKGLKAVENTCRATYDACLDGTYHEAGDLAADRFAQESAGALLGYSERLNHVLAGRSDKAPLYVSSAPFGQASHPTVFVDALLLSKDCTEACARDARAFADFLTSDEVMKAVLMSEDTDEEVTRIPRYLLPATRSVFRVQPLASDPYYPSFERLIGDAVPFPTGGLYERRGDMKKQLTEALKK